MRLGLESDGYSGGSRLSGRSAQVAQQVEAVVPELVHTDGNGYKSLMYDRVAVVAARAIQEQQDVIHSLEARVRALEEQVAAVLAGAAFGTA